MRAIALLIIALVAFPVAGLSAELDAKVSSVSGLIAGGIAANGIRLVGVTEFTNESGGLGGRAGVAGKYFSEKFEEYLIKNRHGYKVVERMRLDKVLKEGVIQASALTDEASSKEIIGKISGLDGLVLGSVIRLGMKASVSCKVVKLPEAEAVTKESFETELDPDLASLFGDCVVASSGGEITKSDIKDQSGGSGVAESVGKCPFKIEIISGGMVKPVYTDGKALYVEATDNEEYSIRLVNGASEAVAMVLLVDGVNSIYENGRPVRDVPSGCRPWVVYPTSQRDFVQSGWQATKDTCKRFVFCSDISQTVAAKLGYTNELGMITAVVYKQASEESIGGKEGERGIDFGTKEGREVTARTESVAFKYGKAPAAILTLRYCGKDRIAGMRRL